MRRTLPASGLAAELVRIGLTVLPIVLRQPNITTASRTAAALRPVALAR